MTKTPPVFLIGIACPLGGLEALLSFLEEVPRDGGMSFVVIQSDAPANPGMFTLSPECSAFLQVRPVEDCLTIEANQVYLVPAGKEVSLRKNVLHMGNPRSDGYLRLPVDYFFRSLAECCAHLSVGVLLGGESGDACDGVFGLRAIKGKGGLTLVQDPGPTAGEGLVRQAIEAGVVDIVAAPEAMPVRIVDYLRRADAELELESPHQAYMLDALDRIVQMLRERRGNDFSLYKRSSLFRRVERRLAVHQLPTLEDYVRYLNENASELDLLFQELLIGVTQFFRDSEVWEVLRIEAIPGLFARYPRGKNLRAWVSACSTGEEAYSLAIAFREALADVKPSRRFTLQIYATDVDPAAVDFARKGLYPPSIAADVSSERLARYFVAESGGSAYRVCKSVREMVVFAAQNVAADPPFTRLDILCCRNLMIYFGAEAQKAMLPVLHYALNPEGLLLLGSAETVNEDDALFSLVHSGARLYRRCGEPNKTPERAMTTPFPMLHAFMPVRSDGVDNIGQLTDQLVQQNFAPAAVLVNRNGDILYVSGRTGKYLEPPAGRTNVNLLAMARDGLREALMGVTYLALRTPEREVVLKGVRIRNERGVQTVDVIVQGLEQPDALRGRVLVVFRDVKAVPKRRHEQLVPQSDADRAMLREMQRMRENLQATHAEIQMTVEDLRASNEELQSTNEELQSANEELTISREQLQSLNEELQLINGELQSRMRDLEWVRKDMKIVLNSLEIAAIFLDRDMRLRRFTTCATDLFRLIPSDIGRPLIHVMTDLNYPNLVDDADEVLKKVKTRRTLAMSHDDRWYGVRIMPFRSQLDVIDGVVITFIDVFERLQDDSDPGCRHVSH
ncbi:CheR family methyltransferase [Propionivibrio dicarboxylicus]|uniref:protein-glutamate O-methyltransferase n=1 Tax=Propionivibrio dicarboxylicus TaxID=83767 RepID=A0A1G8JB17_9RHOO|nr:CheR family methyltransferase [Propionivibrio dicarboxylicus]SDI28281.1 two-component system, chemotaxis family, CheB/CheR fusion protein [Propionivibrio dicarboxylicus]